MLTREPSFSRASTIGVLSSMRRPTRDAIRWHTWATCAASRKRTPDSSSLPRRSTNTLSGPLTMMSVIRSSSSRGSSGPSPSMSLTSSRASARCSRPLSWMRRWVAISARVRSTSWVSSSWVSFASEVGSISPRHSVRNSTIAAPGGRRGGGGGSASWTGAACTAVAWRRPNQTGSSLNPRTASFTFSAATDASIHAVPMRLRRRANCRSGMRPPPARPAR